MTMRIVGNYQVEYPTWVNGHKAERTAFVYPTVDARDQTSQFVTIYGEGRIGCEHPHRLPEYVKAYLRRLN